MSSFYSAKIATGCQLILDTGFWILDGAKRVQHPGSSIQYPVEDPDVLFGETSIQHLASLCIAAKSLRPHLDGFTQRERLRCAKAELHQAYNDINPKESRKWR